MSDLTMGPLEKAYSARRPRKMVGQEISSFHGAEIVLLWQHLDAMSESAAKPEITDSAMSDHIPDASKMVSPPAEALRVAVDMLEMVQIEAQHHSFHDGEAMDELYADITNALARIKEIMGDVK